jgi:hypothetical protein
MSSVRKTVSLTLKTEFRQLPKKEANKVLNRGRCFEIHIIVLIIIQNLPAHEKMKKYHSYLIDVPRIVLAMSTLSQRFFGGYARG